MYKSQLKQVLKHAGFKGLFGVITVILQIVRNRQILMRSNLKLLHPFASWSNPL